MKSKLLLISYLVLLLFLSSCFSKKASPLAKYMPKNIPVVFSLNVGNLIKKADRDIAEMDSYKEFYKNIRRNDKKIARMLDNIVEEPASSGVDWRKSIYMMPYQDGDVTFMLFYASIADKGKFDALVEEFADNVDKDLKYEMDDMDDYSFFEFRNYDNSAGEAIIGWNKKMLVGMFPVDDNRDYDDRDKDDYQERLEDLMELKPEKSLGKNKSFAKFTKGGKDVSMWMSYSEIMDLKEYEDLEDELDIDFSDTYVNMFLEFKKDEVVFESKLEPGEGFKKDMGKNDLFGKGVDKDFIQLLPQSTIFSGSISLMPSSLVSMLEEMNILDEANRNWERDYGVSMEDIMESIEGDVAFALTGMQNETVNRQTFDWNTYNTVTYSTEIMQPKFAAFGKLKDDKFIKKLLKTMPATRKSDYYQIGENGDENVFYIKGEDNLFIVTNDKDIVKGNYDKMKSGEPISLATNNAMMASFGFNFSIEEGMRNGLSNSGFGLMTQRFYEILKENYTGFNLEVDKKGTSSIRLSSASNSDENSLATLIRIIEELSDAKAYEQYVEKWKDKVNLEEVITVPTDTTDWLDETAEAAVDTLDTEETGDY